MSIIVVREIMSNLNAKISKEINAKFEKTEEKFSQFSLFEVISKRQICNLKFAVHLL